jgi:nicotinamidase-related amidase
MATRAPPATALVVIDMMNLLDFRNGAQLARRSMPAVRRMARLKERFVDAGAPVIYANDNFGQWQMDFRTLVEHCAQGPGAAWVEALRPQPDDYYILKPRHSVFFETPLRVLMDQLRIARVVLCGVATDACVLASGIDAHMHGFETIVPSDCVQAETTARNVGALRLLRESFQVDTRASRSIRLR